MPLPSLRTDGTLPPGIHAAPRAEVVARCGTGSTAREQPGELLRQVVAAAVNYPTLKQVRAWGSFLTAKPEPIVEAISKLPSFLMAEFPI